MPKPTTSKVEEVKKKKNYGQTTSNSQQKSGTLRSIKAQALDSAVKKQRYDNHRTTNQYAQRGVTSDVLNRLQPQRTAEEEYDIARNRLREAATVRNYNDAMLPGFDPDANRKYESAYQQFKAAKKNYTSLQEQERLLSSGAYDKQAQKNKFIQGAQKMSYENLLDTINSGYLSNEQRAWGEDILREKANSSQAKTRAQYYNDEADRLESQLAERYSGGTDGTPEGMSLYAKNMQAVENLRNMAKQYEERGWMTERLEYGEAAQQSPTYGQDYMMVPNRAYNKEYQALFGLVSDDELSTKEEISAARRREVMTDDEKRNYSAIYNTQGEEKAHDYLDALGYELDKRIQTQATDRINTRMDTLRNAENVIPDTGLSWLDDYVENTARNIREGASFFKARAANVASGIGALDAAFQRATGEAGRPVNWNTASFTPHTVSQAIQENQLNQIDSSVGRFAYQTAGSMADSLVVMGATILGVPGATAILGGAAATDSMLKAKERGASDSQAVSVGILSGVAEALFEEVSLEKLLTAGTPATWAEAIKNMLARQGITEASEEVATTIANTITDALLMGDKSELRTKIRQYVEQGYSQTDAEKLGAIEWFKDLGMDALGGFVSGAIFGGFEQGISYGGFRSGLSNIQNAQTTGEAVENYGTAMQRVLDENGKVRADSENAAKRLQETYQKTMEGLSDRSTQYEEIAYNIDRQVEEGQMTPEDATVAKAFVEFTMGEQAYNQKAQEQRAKQAAELDEKARGMVQNMGEKSTATISSTQSIVDNYDSSLASPSEYFGAFRYYEEMGQQARATGKDNFAEVWKNDERYSGAITQQAATVAFAAGKTTAAPATKIMQATRSTGTLTYSDEAMRQLANNVKSVAEVKELLTAFAKKSGFDIKIDESLADGENAKFISNAMTIALNPRANVLAGLFHESGHAIQRFNPQAYSQLKADMISWYAQTQGMTSLDQMLKQYGKTYKGYSRDALEIEMVNDAFGSLFNREDAAQDIANWLAANKTEEEQKSFIEKLTDLIDRIVNWVKSLVNLDDVSPMQKRTLEMQVEKAQAFRQQFLADFDVASRSAQETAQYRVDVDATSYDSVAASKSMIDFSLNLATLNYAETYTADSKESKKKLSALGDVLETLWAIEQDIKEEESRIKTEAHQAEEREKEAKGTRKPKYSKKLKRYLTIEEETVRVTSHSIHDINKILESRPDFHQRLIDAQKKANDAGITCDFVTPIGEAVDVEGKAVAPGLRGLPIEYVEAAEGSSKYVERTSDEYRHVGYKFTAFKRTIPQMFLDSVPTNVRESLRVEMVKAVEDAYEKGKGSTILADMDNAFPSIKEIKAVAGASTIENIYGKTMGGVQAPLRHADKTVMALNLNSACPMFTIGNHGCYLDACYLTQMANGATGTNLFRTAWYTGELLQMSDDVIETMNALGGLRINGVGDTTMDNVSQLLDVLKHAQMRGLNVKIITKQAATFDMLSQAKKAGITLPNITVQPSMDNLWVPAALDDVYGAGVRGETQLADTVKKGNLDAAAEAYDEFFGRATKEIDGQLYRKYGFSTEQVNDMIARAKKEFPEVIVTPRYVVCVPEEIAEIALNKHGLIVNSGAIIQTLMHGKVPAGCISDYGTDILNFGGLRHVVERRNGVWDFYGVTVKEVKDADGNKKTVITRASGENSPYEKVKAFINGTLEDGTPRYTDAEKTKIWLTLQESMCCQANESKDACAGCASLCARGSALASVRARNTAYIKQVKEGDQMPSWVEKTEEVEQADYSRTVEDINDDYMQAVERGDMDTAQKLVDEAAEEAGWHPRHTYHGSLAYGFTVFDKNKAHVGGNSGAGFYFSTSKADSNDHYADINGADNWFKQNSLAERIYDAGEWNGVAVTDYAEAMEIAEKEMNKSPGTYDVYLRYDNPYTRNFRRSTDIGQDLQDRFMTDPTIDRSDYDSDEDYEADLFTEEWEFVASEIEYAVSSAVRALEQQYGYGYVYLSGTTAWGISQKILENGYESIDWDTIYNAIESAGDVEITIEDIDEVVLGTAELTRQIIEELGYDAIVDKEVDTKFGQLSRGTERGTEHIIVFSPNQIKSSEPVTYDNDGNVIPLTERFNAEQDDIRYSRRVEDINDEYMDAIESGDTKTQQRLVDEAAKNAGYTIKAYHGTNSKFNVFQRGDVGIHLGSTKGQARTRAGRSKTAQIINARIRLTNPIEFDVDLGSWDADYRLAKELVNRGIITEKEYSGVMGRNANAKLRNLLEEKGYDGITYPNWHEGDGQTAYIVFESDQVKRADPVVYDNDGNVIPLTERFNPNEQDIRYSKGPRTSLTETERRTLEKRVREAEANAKREKARAEHFKSEMRLTPKFAPNAEQTTELATELATMFDGTDVDVEAVAKKLTKVFQNMNRATEYKQERYAYTAMDIAQEIAEDIVAASVPQDMTTTLEGKMMRNEAVAMGTNAIMERLLQVRMAKSTKADKWNAKLQEARQALGREKTKVNRAAQRIANLETEFANYRQDMADRIAFLKTSAAEQHQRDVARLKQTRASRDQKIALRKVSKVVKDLRDYLDKPDPKTGRYVQDNVKEPVAQFLFFVDFLSSSFANEHVLTQADYRELERLDGIKKIAQQSRLMELGDAEAMDGNSPYLDLPPVTQYAIEGLRAYIKAKLGEFKDAENLGMADEGQMHLKVSDAEMLETVYDLARSIQWAVKKMNTLFTKGKYASVEQMSRDTVKHLDGVKKSKKINPTLYNSLGWSMATPYYAFHRFGEAGDTVFENLGAGLADFARNINTILDFVDGEDRKGKTGAFTRAEQKEWANQIVEVDAYDSEKGNIKLKMTVPQLMSLYCLSRREAAQNHLTQGGIALREIKTKNDTVSQEKAVHLTAEQWAHVFDQLTDRQKEVARKLQEFMSTVGSDWGNKVTMERWGVHGFTEKFYFPMATSDAARSSLTTNDSQSMSLYALANMGFTKALQKYANNALVLDDIFNVFSDHMANMAKYSSMVLPMLDAMKWYNWSETNRVIKPGGDREVNVTSLKTAVKDAFGGAATQYFRQFMTDLNAADKEGGAGYDIGSRLMSHYKAAAVGANLRVALLQPTAFFRAAMVLSPADLARGAAMRGGQEEMMKYSGIAQWKDLGFYDTDIGRSVRRQIQGERTKYREFKNKAVDISMKAAEYGDKITWAALWNACKIEQRRANPNVEYEELMRLTEKRFNEVIFSTQVFDSTLSRSEVMRSKDGLKKIMTAFLSEPTLSYNMVLDKFAQFAMDVQKMGKGAAWKKHGNKITRALTVYTVTNLVAALAESLMDAVRDDDDDPFWQKMLEKMFGDWSDVDDPFKAIKAYYSANLMNDMTVLGKIPILKEVVSLAQGYDVGGRMDVQALQSIKNALAVWNEKINLSTGKLDRATKDTWYGNMTTYGAIYKSLQALSQVSGIPVYNGLRDAVGIYNTTLGTLTGKLLTYQTKYDKVDKALDGNSYGITAAIAEAVKKGTAEKDVIKHIKSTIKNRYTGAEGDPMSRDKAKRLLMDTVGLKEKAAEDTLDEWTMAKDTGISYDKMKESFMDGDITEKQAIDYRVKYGHVAREKAEETVANWKAEKNTGYAKDEIADDYNAGNISRAEAIKLYEAYGVSKEDATHNVDLLDFKESHPGAEEFVYTQMETYQQTCEKAKVPVDVFYDVVTLKGKTKADVDANGKAVNGSAREKVLRYIDSLSISKDQKNALYRACGYAESTIGDAPWN